MRLQWLRRDRVHLRRATAGDAAGWREMTQSDTASDWRLAGESSDADQRWVIDADGMMMGGLVLAPVAIDASQPLQPWEALETDPPAPEHDPDVPGRLVTRFFLTPDATLDTTRVTDAPLKALLQVDGRRRLVVRVPLDWLPAAAPAKTPEADPTRAVQWEPSAWLQQFTYRAFQLDALTCWTDAGFRLEGFYPGDPPQARLVWDNSRG
jgi:hypothetical protein